MLHYFANTTIHIPLYLNSLGNTVSNIDSKEYFVYKKASFYVYI